MLLLSKRKMYVSGAYGAKCGTENVVFLHKGERTSIRFWNNVQEGQDDLFENAITTNQENDQNIDSFLEAVNGGLAIPEKNDNSASSIVGPQFQAEEDSIENENEDVESNVEQDNMSNESDKEEQVVDPQDEPEQPENIKVESDNKPNSNDESSSNDQPKETGENDQGKAEILNNLETSINIEKEPNENVQSENDGVSEETIDSMGDDMTNNRIGDEKNEENEKHIEASVAKDSMNSEQTNKVMEISEKEKATENNESANEDGIGDQIQKTVLENNNETGMNNSSPAIEQQVVNESVSTDTSTLASVTTEIENTNSSESHSNESSDSTLPLEQAKVPPEQLETAPILENEFTVADTNYQKQSYNYSTKGTASSDSHLDVPKDDETQFPETEKIEIVVPGTPIVEEKIEILIASTVATTIHSSSLHSDMITEQNEKPSKANQTLGNDEEPAISIPVENNNNPNVTTEQVISTDSVVESTKLDMKEVGSESMNTSHNDTLGYVPSNEEKIHDNLDKEKSNAHNAEDKNEIIDNDPESEHYGSSTSQQVDSDNLQSSNENQENLQSSNENQENLQSSNENQEINSDLNKKDSVGGLDNNDIDTNKDGTTVSKGQQHDIVLDTQNVSEVEQNGLTQHEDALHISTEGNATLEKDTVLSVAPEHEADKKLDMATGIISHEAIIVNELENKTNERHDEQDTIGDVVKDIEKYVTDTNTNNNAHQTASVEEKPVISVSMSKDENELKNNNDTEIKEGTFIDDKEKINSSKVTNPEVESTKNVENLATVDTDASNVNNPEVLGESINNTRNLSTAHTDGNKMTFEETFQSVDKLENETESISSMVDNVINKDKENAPIDQVENMVQIAEAEMNIENKSEHSEYPSADSLQEKQILEENNSVKDMSISVDLEKIHQNANSNSEEMQGDTERDTSNIIDGILKNDSDLALSQHGEKINNLDRADSIIENNAQEESKLSELVEESKVNANNAMNDQEKQSQSLNNNVKSKESLQNMVNSEFLTEDFEHGISNENDNTALLSSEKLPETEGQLATNMSKNQIINELKNSTFSNMEDVDSSEGVALSSEENFNDEKSSIVQATESGTTNNNEELGLGEKKMSVVGSSMDLEMNINIPTSEVIELQLSQQSMNQHHASNNSIVQEESESTSSQIKKDQTSIIANSDHKLEQENSSKTMPSPSSTEETTIHTSTIAYETKTSTYYVVTEKSIFEQTRPTLATQQVSNIITETEGLNVEGMPPTEKSKDHIEISQNQPLNEGESNLEEQENDNVELPSESSPLKDEVKNFMLHETSQEEENSVDSIQNGELNEPVEQVSSAVIFPDDEEYAGSISLSSNSETDALIEAGADVRGQEIYPETTTGNSAPGYVPSIAPILADNSNLKNENIYDQTTTDGPNDLVPNYEDNGDLIYNETTIGTPLGFKPHIEPIIVDLEISPENEDGSYIIYNETTIGSPIVKKNDQDADEIVTGIEIINNVLTIPVTPLLMETDKGESIEDITNNTSTTINEQPTALNTDGQESTGSNEETIDLNVDKTLIETSYPKTILQLTSTSKDNSFEISVDKVKDDKQSTDMNTEPDTIASIQQVEKDELTNNESSALSLENEPGKTVSNTESNLEETNTTETTNKITDNLSIMLELTLSTNNEQLHEGQDNDQDNDSSDVDKDIVPEKSQPQSNYSQVGLSSFENTSQNAIEANKDTVPASNVKNNKEKENLDIHEQSNPAPVLDILEDSGIKKTEIVSSVNESELNYATSNPITHESSTITNGILGATFDKVLEKADEPTTQSQSSHDPSPVISNESSSSTQTSASDGITAEPTNPIEQNTLSDSPSPEQPDMKHKVDDLIKSITIQSFQSSNDNITVSSETGNTYVSDTAALIQPSNTEESQTSSNANANADVSNNDNSESKTSDATKLKLSRKDDEDILVKTSNEQKLEDDRMSIRNKASEIEDDVDFPVTDLLNGIYKLVQSYITAKPTEAALPERTTDKPYGPSLPPNVHNAPRDPYIFDNIRYDVEHSNTDPFVELPAPNLKELSPKDDKGVNDKIMVFPIPFKNDNPRTISPFNSPALKVQEPPKIITKTVPGNGQFSAGPLPITAPIDVPPEQEPFFLPGHFLRGGDQRLASKSKSQIASKIVTIHNGQFSRKEASTPDSDSSYNDDTNIFDPVQSLRDGDEHFYRYFITTDVFICSN